MIQSSFTLPITGTFTVNAHKKNDEECIEYFVQCTYGMYVKFKCVPEAGIGGTYLDKVGMAKAILQGCVWVSRIKTGYIDFLTKAGRIDNCRTNSKLWEVSSGLQSMPQLLRQA